MQRPSNELQNLSFKFDILILIKITCDLQKITEFYSYTISGLANLFVHLNKMK